MNENIHERNTFVVKLLIAVVDCNERLTLFRGVVHVEVNTPSAFTVKFLLCLGIGKTKIVDIYVQRKTGLSLKSAKTPKLPK